MIFWKVYYFSLLPILRFFLILQSIANRVVFPKKYYMIFFLSSVYLIV